MSQDEGTQEGTGSPAVPPALPSEEPGMISVDIPGLFYQFAKTFVLIFPVYVLGYFGLSFSWLLIALVCLMWFRKNKGNKSSRLHRALAFLENEEKTVKHSISSADLPAWVHFPDIERAEWLNKTVKHMWPFICQFIDKLFRETIEPAVRGANAHLSTFCFTKIDMGTQPLRVNGVKVYTENVDKRQIILDLQISFVGNTEIDLEIKRYFCRAGVKSIQLHGTVRVILEPLLGDIPIIGALSLFFLKKPSEILIVASRTRRYRDYTMKRRSARYSGHSLAPSIRRDFCPAHIFQARRIGRRSPCCPWSICRTSLPL